MVSGSRYYRALESVSIASSGVTMGWLLRLRLVTGGPTDKGPPDSSRVFAVIE